MNTTTQIVSDPAPARQPQLGEICTTLISDDEAVCGCLVSKRGLTGTLRTYDGIEHSAPIWMIKASETVNLPPTPLETIFGFMRMGKSIDIRDHEGRSFRGIVNGILREDGSGQNWLIHLHHGEAVFIRYNS